MSNRSPCSETVANWEDALPRRSASHVAIQSLSRTAPPVPSVVQPAPADCSLRRATAGTSTIICTHSLTHHPGASGGDGEGDDEIGNGGGNIGSFLGDGGGGDGATCTLTPECRDTS